MRLAARKRSKDCQIITFSGGVPIHSRDTHPMSREQTGALMTTVLISIINVIFRTTMSRNASMHGRALHLQYEGVSVVGRSL